MAKVGDGYVEVQPDLDMFATRLRAALTAVPAEDEGKRLGNRIGVSMGTSMKAGIGSSIGRTGALVAGLATLAGPLSATLSGLSAATTALGGSLAYVAGTAATLPTGIGALAQGYATTKIAASGLEDALKALSARQSELSTEGEVSEATQNKVKEAMAGLSPAARDLAKSLIATSGAWAKVRKSIQESALKGAGSTVKALAKTYLPILQQELGGTAAMFNRLGKQAAKWAQTKSVTRDMGTLFRANTRILRILGQAGGAAFDGLRHLMIASIPATVALSKSLRRGMESFRDWAKEGRKSGQLAAFLDKARRSGRILWQVIKNVGAALGATFSAGYQDGNTLLRMLERITRRWANWSKDAGGQNTLKAWFAEGVETAHEFGKLIGDVSDMFKGLSATSDSSDFVAMIRTQLLPPLSDLLIQLNKSGTGEALIGAIGAISTALADMDAGGGLATFLNTLSTLVTTIAEVVTSVPGLTTALGGLLGAYATFKAVGLVAGPMVGATKGIYGLGKAAKKGITGVRAFSQGFRDVRSGASAFAGPAQRAGAMIRTNLSAASMVAKAKLTALGTALKTGAVAVGRFVAAQARLAASFARATAAALAQKVALIAQKVAMLAARAAAVAMAVAQRILNAVMRMNPIGLIITALIALGAGLVLLYKKSETFRRIVNGAFAGVKAAGKMLWNGLKAVFKGIAKVITTYVRVYVTVLKVGWKVISTVVKTAIRVVSTVIRTGFNIVKTIISTVLRVIKALFTGNWREIPRILGEGVAKVKSLIKDGFTKAVSIIKDTFGKAVGAAKTVLTQVVNAVTGFGSDMLQAGKDLVTGLINGIKNMAGQAKTAAENMVKGAIDGAKKLLRLGSPSRLFRKFGVWTVEGYVEGVKDKGKRAAMEAALTAFYEKAAKVAAKGFRKGILGSEKSIRDTWTRLSRFASDTLTGKAETAAKRMIADMADRWEVWTKRRENMAKRIVAAEKEVTKALKAQREYAAKVAGAAIGYAGIIGSQSEGPLSSEQVLNDMKRRSAAVAEFAANVALLSKRGLNKTTMREIIEAGVDGGAATAAALASGGKAAITTANQLTKDVSGIAKRLGTFAGNEFYQSGVDAAQGLVNGLNRKMGVLQRTMRKVARAMTDSLKKQLGIKSPSTVFAGIGDNTALGFAQGVRRRQGDAHGAIHGLVTQPGRLGPPAGHLARSLPAKPEEHFNVRVFIGDTELKGIVRTEISRNNNDVAKAINRGRRVPA